MKEGYYHNTIEAMIGLQFACTIDYFNMTDKLEYSIPKMGRYFRICNPDHYLSNQTYYDGLKNYVFDNYHRCVEMMAKYIPEDKAEYLFWHCAYIISASNKENDIALLKKIQLGINIPNERAKQIVLEAIEEVKNENEIEKYVDTFGKYGFIIKEAFSKINNGIEKY